MSDGTKIEWADATVNAINGCSVHSPGCSNCFAMRAGGRNLPSHPSTGLTMPTKAGHVWTGEVRLSETALLQPLRWKRGRRIFWNAHGDLFHEKVPDEWIDRVFAVCAQTPQHRHMILTKRSVRMRTYISKWGGANGPAAYPIILDMSRRQQTTWPSYAWPLPNVWLGVSVEDQTRADERIPDLLATPAAVRFISAEPLLGPVKLPFEPGTAWCPICKAIVPDGIGSPHERVHGVEIGDHYDPTRHCATVESMINWVIAGGESGPGARPRHPDWARSLRDQCAAAGVAFHFKQWGSCLPGNMDGEDEHGAAAYEIEDCAQPVDYDDLGRGRWIFAHECEFIRFHRKTATGRMLDGRTHDEFPA